MIHTVHAGEYTVRGVSVAGMYTCLQIPELGVLLDIGIPLRRFAGTHDLFLSHVHGDHVGGLASWLGMRDMLGMPKTRIFLPEEHLGSIAGLVEVASHIHRFRVNAEFIPLKPDEEMKVRSDIFVRPFRTHHSMPSLGYQFFRRKTKLRPEFKHLTGSEIAARKAAGDLSMFEQVESLELAYATDTTSEVLKTAPNLLQSYVTIMECTYVDDEKTSAWATSGGHMHLRDIVAAYKGANAKNKHLVLMHFSQTVEPVNTAQKIFEELDDYLDGAVHAFGTDSLEWFG